jgi:hypothetical protein
VFTVLLTMLPDYRPLGKIVRCQNTPDRPVTHQTLPQQRHVSQSLVCPTRPLGIILV